jgi:hypothetical protein
VIVEDPSGWANRARDGALFVLGFGMIIAETIGSVVYGRTADYLIVGAGLVILGVIPRLPEWKR